MPRRPQRRRSRFCSSLESTPSSSASSPASIGRNLTGVNQFINTLSAKRLQLLREMLPGLTSIAFLVKPDSPQAEFETLDLQTAARAIGVRIEILTAHNTHDIDALSPILAQQQISALFVAANPFLASQISNLIAMA